MVRTVVALPAAAFLFLAAGSAVAQPTPTAPQPSGARNQDPNEVICEKQKVIGSRLAVKRVCRTRAEWADLRLQDRQEIEKIQTQRGMKDQ